MSVVFMFYWQTMAFKKGCQTLWKTNLHGINRMQNFFFCQKFYPSQPCDSWVCSDRVTLPLLCQRLLHELCHTDWGRSGWKLSEAALLAPFTQKLCVPPARSCSEPCLVFPLPHPFGAGQKLEVSALQPGFSFLRQQELCLLAPGPWSAWHRGCSSSICWHLFVWVSTIPSVQICNLLTFAHNRSKFLSADLNLECNSIVKNFSQLCRATFF